MNDNSPALFFKQKSRQISRHKSWRLGLLFVCSALIMFGIVWWPIQAERSRRLAQQWQEKISEEKTKLRQLQLTYQQLTSLPVLDQWAKRHGPWKSLSADDVISL